MVMMMKTRCGFVSDCTMKQIVGFDTVCCVVLPGVLIWDVRDMKDAMGAGRHRDLEDSGYGDDDEDQVIATAQ